MSYNKLGFTKGQTLKAEHLNHMEEGIANVSWNDLTDKPFCEYMGYSDTFSINLDALSSEDVVMDTSGSNIKVSDATPTLNDLVNGVIMQSTENGQYHLSYDDILYENENSPFDDDDMVTFEMFVVIPSDNFTVNFDGEEMVFPEKGIYILAEVVAGEAGILDVTIPGYNGFETTVTKKIDEKYLPAVGVTKFYIICGESGNYFHTSVDSSEETRVHSKDIDAAVSRGTIVLCVVAGDGNIDYITYPRYISRGKSGYYISADGNNGTELGLMTSDFTHADT